MHPVQMIDDERIDVERIKLAHEDYIKEICIHISKLGKSKQKQKKGETNKIKTTKIIGKKE